MPRIDALQKYRNQLLSAYNSEQLQSLKYDNWSGLLTETDRLYATMFHDWDVLQKDSSDLAEAVQSLEWTVAPYVTDGEEPDTKAQAVAKVVTDALWKRTTHKPGTFNHSFPQLIGAITHALFRGFNVHEIEWVNDGELVYPAAFHQLPAQFMRWENRAGKVDRLLFVPDGETEEPRDFPEHKFIVALNSSGPDHPLYNALYYSLIAWYGASKFGLGWFMEYCQKYGMPKLVFHYESDRDRQQLEADLAEERVLNNILLKGDRAVDIANAPASGASLPQRELLNLAESQCHKLILGQTLTSDTSEHGGSLAQARVHAGVQAEVVKKRAAFVADVLNTQLIPAIVLLNFGTTDVPMPELVFKLPQEGVTLDRVQVLKTALEIKGMKIKKTEAYEFIGFAQPAEDDDVFEASQEAAQGGMGGMFGQQPPPGGKGPQKGQQPPDGGDKAQPGQQTKQGDNDEPVQAAKAPVDPAQEWIAPIKAKFLEARKNGASMADIRAQLLKLHPDTKALARAFANNILAGFAGEEEVDAANPYGCNQYGEGWASEHNGKRSTPGKPVKKGEQDDEIIAPKKKEDEIIAPKKKEDVEQTEVPSSPIGKAKTREEAIEHSRSLLSPKKISDGEIVFSERIPLEMINEFNSVVGSLVEKYPTARLRKIESYVSNDKSEGAHASDWCIGINEDHEKGGVWNFENWKSYGYFKKQATGYSRHNVGATENGISMKDVLTHEYGHVIHHGIAYFYDKAKEKGENALASYKLKKPKEYELMTESVDIFKKATTKRDGDSLSDCQRFLSEYASTNHVEFFAESFAARERGEKIPDYIESFLDKVINFVVIKGK